MIACRIPDEISLKSLTLPVSIARAPALAGCFVMVNTYDYFYPYFNWGIITFRRLNPVLQRHGDTFHVYIGIFMIFASIVCPIVPYIFARGRKPLFRYPVKITARFFFFLILPGSYVLPLMRLSIVTCFETAAKVRCTFSPLFVLRSLWGTGHVQYRTKKNAKQIILRAFSGTER